MTDAKKFGVAADADNASDIGDASGAGTFGGASDIGDASGAGTFGGASDIGDAPDAGTFGGAADAENAARIGNASEALPEAAEALRRRFAAHTPGLLGASRAYAVLCPLVETPDGLSLLYEVRAAGIRQGGEVCFPGGRMEDGETPLQCALRETEEELSIPRECVTPLGRMDFLCNQRGFLLHPVPAFVRADGLRLLRASPGEVAETFTAPLSYFRDTPPRRYFYDLTPRPPADFPYSEIGIPSDYPWAAGRVEVPVWRWRGRVVWGMTARITAYLVNNL